MSTYLYIPFLKLSIRISKKCRSYHQLFLPGSSPAKLSKSSKLSAAIAAALAAAWTIETGKGGAGSDLVCLGVLESIKKHTVCSKY